jgi:ribosomal protein S18 acetylase RimI-like enzyme
MVGMGQGCATVSVLTADQWPLLRELRLAALGEAPEAFWAIREDEARYREEDWRRWLATSVWLVARDDGGPVGLCALLPREDPAEPELISMWVRPEARRRGHARALLERACTEAAAAGAASVALWVVEGNNGASDLYRRAGFARTGEREPMPRGGSHEVRLRRELRHDAAGGRG